MKREKLQCFIAISTSLRNARIYETIKTSAVSAGYLVTSRQQGLFPDQVMSQETLAGDMAMADVVIADLSDQNPNVFLEIGIALAMNKGIVPISEEAAYKDVPFDVKQFRVITYANDPNGISQLGKKISSALEDFRHFPKQKFVSPSSRRLPPFFVDWDRLSRRETENLFQELLAQLGFRRLDWGKGTKEIDLIAELPKKDPDGYEYRELWLVSMGAKMRIEMFLEMASKDPDFLLHRLVMDSERFFEGFQGRFEGPITILVLLAERQYEGDDLQFLRERIEKTRFRRERYGLNIRLRVWERDYLTSLVQRFPQIGYKYFSDEGRLRSKTRKSYEDLYLENYGLSERQAKLIVELEDERGKRVRAERDAIWKDISFSAAHKIGNPIFAIETDLNPLQKRINEDRKNDAMEVIQNIKAAVEKAKCFVEQFKSLARSQEIKPVPSLLLPIFKDAEKTIQNRGIKIILDCSPEIMVFADPDRIAECFDELFVNSVHWFDKDEKEISVIVTEAIPDSVPTLLDAKKKYILVHVLDNGIGVAPEIKERIFDAFYTTNEHGTGLGLALVRRIIDGHGGKISEVGLLGKGANFEIYLPKFEESQEVESHSNGKSPLKRGRK